MSTTETWSDWDIFDRSLTSLLGNDRSRLAAVYDSFVAVNDERNSALRQLGFGMTVAFLSTFGILSADNEIMGFKLQVEYFAIVAVAYATICYVRLTIVDLKHRLFERLFKLAFDREDSQGRAEIALSYPRAFAGTVYIATTFLPAGYVVDGRQAISLGSLLVVMFAAFGFVLVLWPFTLWALWASARAPAETAVHAVILLHAVAIGAVSLVHRNPKTRRHYERP